MSRGGVLFAILMIGGCGEGSAITGDIGDENPAVAMPAETSWQGQVAAVRAGDSDEIRIDSGASGGVTLADLATGCDRLRSLWVEDVKPSDGDLDPLASLEHLETLTLTARVDDGDLARIVKCRGLIRLNLPNSEIGDEGFAAITKLTELEQLRIGSPRLTDQGLASLREIPELRFLHLIDVPITDAGLSHVAAVRTLESFYLDGGAATGKGVRELLRQRPDVHFHKDQLHLPGDPNAHP